MTLTRAFNKARDAVDGYRDLISSEDVSRILETLEKESFVVLYDENEQGGDARQVVAAVARVLDVDLDAGTGHRWDPEHMARVISAAEQMRGARDAWKETAEANDAANAPLRFELRDMRRNYERTVQDFQRTGQERDRLKEERDAAVERGDVDELKAVIVSQAREIARLKGASE
ncbi:hypothetical protein ACFVRU_01380 [Streptomyces sp. NPDC057927]